MDNYNLLETIDHDTQRETYTVSQLNREVFHLLDESFPVLWVEGEISNLSRPSSGHFYFSLKDEFAQVRCAMFKNSNRFLEFQPEDGMQILVRAKVSLYQARGDYQLIVETMEEAGDGVLKRAFEHLKKKLAQEGLFDVSKKKPLPKLPKQIGIITSATGAAIHDILRVLQRRFASIPIIIYPTHVQGVEASSQIIKAISTANKRQECDVLIIARGGGSLEDLWCFNDENVARAIHVSKIPTVAGIGHEVDFTIADLVADQRAATPSAAAELVSPASSEWQDVLANLEKRITHLITARLQHDSMYCKQLQKRLKHPRQILQENVQYLDLLEQRLRQSYIQQIQNKRFSLQQNFAKLQAVNPQQKIHIFNTKTNALQQRLLTAMNFQLKQSKQKLSQLTHTLDTISPLQTLSRGYAIVTRVNDQVIIKDANKIRVGEKVNTRLAKGELECQVTSIRDK